VVFRAEWLLSAVVISLISALTDPGMKNFLAILVIALCLALSVILYKTKLQNPGSLDLFSDYHGPSAVNIAAILQPQRDVLASPITTRRPLDLVPPLTFFREKILDHQTRAPAEKKPVYDTALEVVDEMLKVANERTQALQALIKGTRQMPGSLDAREADMRKTNAFFGQTVVKRWDDRSKVLMPKVDQLLLKLRDVEMTWNHSLQGSVPMESWETPNFNRSLVRMDDDEEGTLERGAYDQRRNVIPRRSPDSY